ncbi:hypothetical protein GIB67_024126 [Kingdonia uniflora]|uniref:Ribosomal protein L1 n=1 Tax=Kingdonia uniflora TaxID=39325 RepID=A0A7J7MMQ1_9MAGN|nr:hypothetical protein GIB67_024126 [Kingdonia uniflora]
MALTNPNSLPHLSSTSRVPLETTTRAIDSLLKWVKSKSQNPQLLEPDDFIYLILTLKKIPSNGRTNPYKIPLPNPLHPFNSVEERCLIIDDRSKVTMTSADAKKKIEADGIPISKVIKLSKLKSDYRPFEAKRKLCSSYDMFFADNRVIPLLPRLLGKEFFKKKKIPVPINLTHKNWKEQIENVCGSALLYLRTGTCSVIRVGRVSMSRDELVANVGVAIDGIAEIVPKKWLGIRSFHLKSTESVALPLYHVVPDLGLKIEGIKGKAEDVDEGDMVEVGGESDDEGVLEVKEKKSDKKKKKGVKRGRIHEVNYLGDDLDDLLGEISSDGDDEEVEVKKSENTELGDVEMSGKKRKKVKHPKKEQVISEDNGEKKVKKSTKLKKQKKDEVGSAEKMDSTEVKKRKSRLKQSKRAKKSSVVE